MQIANPAAFLALSLFAAQAFAAYDANGVALGASEQQVKKSFPSAYCKPLEWASRAADRRCDDAKMTLGGIDARITFYLRKDAVQAFDLRFDTKDLDKLVAYLKSRYGKPFSELKEVSARDAKSGAEIYKVRWEKGTDRAVLVSQLEKKRSSLIVSRGDWEEEIYRVR
jgi:hypothetical protein